MSDREHIVGEIAIALATIRDCRPNDEELAGFAVEILDTVTRNLVVEPEQEHVRVLQRVLLAEDPYAARMIVGRYFRIRAQHPGVGLGSYGQNSMLSGSGSTASTKKLVTSLFTQLAADVEHSDLLRRLFSGEEPLPYEEWQEQQGK